MATEITVNVLILNLFADALISDVFFLFFLSPIRIIFCIYFLKNHACPSIQFTHTLVDDQYRSKLLKKNDTELVQSAHLVSK